MPACPEFNPRQAAKQLLRQARNGALATLTAGSGDPYCSLVNVATTPAGAPILLLSELAIHTRNVLADPRVSLMLAESTADDPLQGARVMLAGAAARSDDPHVRRRYLARHPKARAYADFADFGFYVIALKGAHLVAGFGRIVDLAPEQLQTDTAGAEALTAAEAELIAHLNEDHAATCRLYAVKLLGGAVGDWECVGCDPEGLDLQSGRAGLRLSFPQRVSSPGELRQVLRDLADQARAR